MPRNGSGIYSIPPGTEGIQDTPVESEPYNAFIHDIETDQNTPRPVVAGGTGANNVATARTNLGAEAAGQQVTNYDSHAFVAGSFYSATSATNPPVAAHAFAGTAYLSGADVVVEATDLSTRLQYIRTKVSGVWSAWTLSGGAGSFLPLAGGVLTGDLYMSKANPFFMLNKQASGEQNIIRGGMQSAGRWDLYLGDGIAEDASNNGSRFQLVHRANDGSNLGTALLGDRATGLLSVKADPTAALGIVTKQYADAISTVVATKAPLASPVFSGNPTAPTPAVGDDDTSIATTAFVKNGVNLAAATDFNLVVDPGTYNAPTPDCTNTPVASRYWTLLVMRHSNTTYLTQACTDITTGFWYFRSKIASVWGPWRLVYDASQAATGAEFFANTATTKVVNIATAWDAAAQLGFTGGAATFTPPLGAASDHYWNLNSATGTLNAPSNPKSGQKGIIVINHTLAGAKTMTWNAIYKFPGGVKPVLSTALNAIDVISYVYNNNLMLCTFNADFK